jgi:hypothetical protein
MTDKAAKERLPSRRGLAMFHQRYNLRLLKQLQDATAKGCQAANMGGAKVSRFSRFQGFRVSRFMFPQVHDLARLGQTCSFFWDTRREQYRMQVSCWATAAHGLRRFPGNWHSGSRRAWTGNDHFYYCTFCALCQGPVPFFLAMIAGSREPPAKPMMRAWAAVAARPSGSADRRSRSG